MNDIEWMQQAMNEAAKGGWTVHPNPMVGAIIVRHDQELGRGYHHKAGMPHAEIEALRQAQELGHDVRDATIYVTLEPCNHYGRTPPCTEALIKAGIKRCVIGSVDSDSRVRGAGIRRLQEAGIECVVGVCQNDLLELNAAFFTRTRDNRPFITAKWAMTADGHTATATGSSQWITGPEARRDVHAERSKHDAIIAGTQTILLDNPQLNVRLDGTWKQPIRIILDRTLRIPLSHNVFDTTNQKTILFTANHSAETAPWQDRGVCIEYVEETENRLNLTQILQTLAQKYTITTLYCEGGAALHGALLDQHLIDQVHIYMAPKLTGGLHARGCIAGTGIDKMSDAAQFSWDEIIRLGSDIRLSGRLRWS